MYHHLATRRRAFSLIELAVVLIVVAVIAAIAIPTFQATIQSSQDNAESVELAAVLRSAHALGRLRGNELPTAQDVADALAEIGAAAPGVGAYIEISTTARLYSQSEWDAAPIVPPGVRAYVYASDPANDRVGVATISSSDPTTCVAVVLVSGAAPQSFTQPVAGAADCDGHLALGGPVEPVEPTAGEQIEAGMTVTGDSTTPGWDDLSITDNATTTYLADDFDRADGPLGPPYLDLSGAGLPPVEVVSNTASGSATEALHASVVSVPAFSALAVTATLTGVPAVDRTAALLVADLATFSSEAYVSAGTYSDDGFTSPPGGLARYRHQVSVPGNPQAYVYKDAGPAAPGDEVKVTRLSPTLSTLHVNGQLRSTMNRGQVATLTGSVTGVADPTLCTVSVFATSATHYESYLVVGGSGTVAADGTFTAYAPTTGAVKVGAHCPVVGTRFTNGAIWAAGAATFSLLPGQTVSLPAISMS